MIICIGVNAVIDFVLVLHHFHKHLPNNTNDAAHVLFDLLILAFVVHQLYFLFLHLLGDIADHVLYVILPPDELHIILSHFVSHISALDNRVNHVAPVFHDTQFDHIEEQPTFVLSAHTLVLFVYVEPRQLHFRVQVLNKPKHVRVNIVVQFTPYSVVVSVAVTEQQLFVHKFNLLNEESQRKRLVELVCVVVFDQHRVEGIVLRSRRKEREEDVVKRVEKVMRVYEVVVVRLALTTDHIEEVAYVGLGRVWRNADARYLHLNVYLHVDLIHAERNRKRIVQRC